MKKSLLTIALLVPLTALVGQVLLQNCVLRGGAVVFGHTGPLVIPDVTDGLVAHWEFEECSGTTADDTSPNSNTGTFVNGMAFTASGKVGCGMESTGLAGEYVDCGNHSSLDLHAAMSITLWLNAADNSNPQTLIFGDMGVGTPIYNITTVNLIDDQYFFNFEYWTEVSPPTPVTAATAATVTWGSWHFFGVTRAGDGTIHLYLDGSPATIDSDPGANGPAFGTTLDKCTLARAGNFDGQNFSGKLDSVRIYNRELSTSEMLVIYNNQH